MREQDSRKSMGDTDFGTTIPCQYNHPLVMSSVYVLKALKDFLAVYHVAQPGLPTMQSRLTYKRSTVSRLMAESDIEGYWKNYTTVFPKEREQLWDSLLEGLKKYHNLLKGL